MYNTLGAAPTMVGDSTPTPSIGPPLSARPGAPGPAAPGAFGNTLPLGYQQQNIPGITGGLNNMVRALLAGRYQNHLADSYTQPSPIGPPMNINPRAQQTGMLTTPPPPGAFNPNVTGGLM